MKNIPDENEIDLMDLTEKDYLEFEFYYNSYINPMNKGIYMSTTSKFDDKILEIYFYKYISKNSWKERAQFENIYAYFFFGF